MPVIKNYKADLKAKYSRNLKLSIIVAITVLIAAFKFSPSESKLDVDILEPQDIIKIEDILNTAQKPKPPKPLTPPKIIEASIDDPIEEIELDDIEIVENAQLSPLPDPPKIVDEELPFIWVEEMPQPIGGMKAIQEKVIYTEIAVRTRVEGKVIIEAIIDKNGNVINAKIIRDIGGGLGESALKAVLTTKFSPGKQRGIPVKVKVMIPVKFVLN